MNITNPRIVNELKRLENTNLVLVNPVAEDSLRKFHIVVLPGFVKEFNNELYQQLLTKKIKHIMLYLIFHDRHPFEAPHQLTWQWPNVKHTWSETMPIQMSDCVRKEWTPAMDVYQLIINMLQNVIMVE